MVTATIKALRINMGNFNRTTVHSEMIHETDGKTDIIPPLLLHVYCYCWVCGSVFTPHYVHIKFGSVLTADLPIRQQTFNS